MKIFAAMDIGTNSVRLGVVEVQKDYTWTTLASQKQVVRLGEGEFAGPDKKRKKDDGENERHRLTEEAIARGALVCARFAEVARGFGAEEIVALATAAVREAENGDEFVEQVREKADLDVRVISGPEEARLIYLGVASGIELPAGKNALIMDIGGGSTELIVGDAQRYAFLDSLRMGAIRLTQEFLGDAARPVTATQWAAMTRHVRSALAPASRAIARAGYAVMYGSSGTIQNIAEIAANAHPGPVPTSFRNFHLPLAEVQAISRRLCAMTLEQRRRIPGINPERGDIILGGAAILQATMETVGATGILLSDRALREGIVVDRLMREAASPALTSPSGAVAPELGAGGRPSTTEPDHALAGARLRSIRKLMRATNVDEVHAAHIVHLSLSLFDQWKALGLHDYGRARELLEYAALLHDAGFFVSHTDHQQHSYYLIRHSELLGFNDREIEIIASLALYHRKSAPRRKHAQFSALDAKAQRAIRILSCALRLAEALDRSHLMLVRAVQCERLGKPDRILMTVVASSDAQLELWAAQGQAPIFEKTFGLPLEVRVQQMNRTSEATQTRAAEATR